MTKMQFISALHDGLSGLDENEIEERLTFYSELIDDQIEEGISEEEAVANIGTVENTVSQIIAETPITKIIKKRINPKKALRTWELILIILGFPVWFPVLIAAFCVVISIYVILWAVIVSLWAVFASLCATSLGFAAGGVLFIATDNIPSGIALIGAGIVLAGLSILMFFCCRYATKGTAILTKKIAVGIKKCFIKKEAA